MDGEMRCCKSLISLFVTDVFDCFAKWLTKNALEIMVIRCELMPVGNVSCFLSLLGRSSSV